jgi:hypothetical protein
MHRQAESTPRAATPNQKSWPYPFDTIRRSTSIDEPFEILGILDAI